MLSIKYVLLSLSLIFVGCTPRYTLPERINESLESMFEPGYRIFVQITVEGGDEDEWLQIYFRKIALESLEEGQGESREFKFPDKPEGPKNGL